MLYKKFLIAGLNLLVIGMHAAESSEGIIVGTELHAVRPFEGSALNLMSGVMEDHPVMRTYQLQTFGYVNIQDEIAKYLPENNTVNTEQSEIRFNSNDWYREFFFPFICGAGMFIAGNGYFRYVYSNIDWRYISGLAGVSLLGGSLFAAYRTGKLKEHFKSQGPANTTARREEGELLDRIMANEKTFIAVHRSIWNGWQLRASSYAGYKSQCHSGISDPTVYPTPPQCNELTKYIIQNYVPARRQTVYYGSREDDHTRKRALSGNRTGKYTTGTIGALCIFGALAVHIKKS